MDSNKRKRSNNSESNKAPKRKKLSNEDYLINKLFENKTSVVKKKAILIFGCPGSGKSNYIEVNKNKFRNYVKVSRDYFIENNKEINNSPKKWSVLQNLVIRVEDKAIDSSKNILWEVTGRNWSDISRIRKICKSNSYNLKLIFIKSDEKECKNRIIYREKYNDRKVSIKNFDKVSNIINSNFLRIKKNLNSNEDIILNSNNWSPIF